MKRLIVLVLLFSLNIYPKEESNGLKMYKSVCLSLFTTALTYKYSLGLSGVAPQTFYMANHTRGLFDGLDRETHFVGGLGLYYWMRHNGNSKATALLKTTLYSLAWEAKDGLKFMNYNAPWFHRTSVGNLLIHFAGDGFDIKDHYCVMLGAGTAIIFEYANELIFPNKRLRLIPFGVEARF